MFDLDNDLDKIMRKYGLPEPPLAKDRIADAMRRVVFEYTSKYGSRIIVRGLKYSSKGEYPILDLISEYGNIVAIVDKSPFADEIQLKNGNKIKIFDEKNARNVECDVYIIHSIYQGRNIYFELMTSNKKFQIIDLYTELRIRYGIAPRRTYDEYEKERDFSHNKTYEAYQLFQRCRDVQHLKQLLSACLSNRDFITFYEVIDEISGTKIDNNIIYGLKKDIDQILNKIKLYMEMRNTNSTSDVIIHWIDQASYEELKYYPLLKDKLDKGLFFENAYAVTPYTSATETCIFYPEEMHGLNKTNQKEIISERGLESSEIYQNILNNGYDFVMMGYMSEKCMPEKRNEYTQFMVASSVYYWNMLNHIIHTQKPVFGVIGCLSETHEPWMSPRTEPYNPSFEFNGRYSMSENKMQKSAQYFDKVVSFFSELFCPKTINIYMSDHGKWEDINLRRYSDYAMHTILGITNIGIMGKVTRIFSYRYFAEMIRWVMQCAHEETSEHIFGDMEIRSTGFKSVIRNSIESFYTNEQDVAQIYSDICCGYEGIKTARDTYIHLNNGNEIYYLNEDERINRIDESKYGSRINSLRKKLTKRNE